MNAIMRHRILLTQHLFRKILVSFFLLLIPLIACFSYSIVNLSGPFPLDLLIPFYYTVKIELPIMVIFFFFNHININIFSFRAIQCARHIVCYSLHTIQIVFHSSRGAFPLLLMGLFNKSLRMLLLTLL